MDIFSMLMSFAGGLGLFMYGMKIMGEGLERAAGDRMRHLIEVLTTNRVRGVLVGVIVTAIIQSSSATTVMVIGFVNAGLMTLAQTTGVIMGANIGTTITAQLIAFKLTKIAPVILFAGVGILFFSKNRKLKKLSEILVGFGLLFMGMSFMSGAMKPLRTNEAFIEFMVNFDNPLLGVVAGCVVTMILQSSSASIGILQAFAMQNLIGLDAAIFILLGQNIGTCITAMLASIGTSITARRAATIHLMFNVFGTLLFIIIMFVGLPFTDLVKMIGGSSTRQIANAHTIFNVSNTIILFPLANMLVKLSKRIIPGEEAAKEAKRLKYLDTRIFETPPIAVAQILKEVKRMAILSRRNVALALNNFGEENEKIKKNVKDNEDIINFLNHQITHYLVKANGLDLSVHDLNLVGGLFHVVNDIERIGDHAENIAEYSEASAENGVVFSEKAKLELSEMKEKVLEMIDESIEILMERDKEKTKDITKKEQGIDDLKAALRKKHIRRLNENKCTPESGIVFLDVVSNLERIGDHATNIAYSVLDD